MAVRRDLLVSRAWVQAVAIVVLFGFLVLGILAWQTYAGEPPIAARTIAAGGRLLFSKDDVLAGQGVFLRNGLMEYGSIFGHGAYLGPDYTADYLHRAARSRTRWCTQRPRRAPLTSFGTITRNSSASRAPVRIVLRRDQRSRRHSQTNRVFQLVGLGIGGHLAGQAVFVHEQLATRAAGG